MMTSLLEPMFSISPQDKLYNFFLPLPQECSRRKQRMSKIHHKVPCHISDMACDYQTTREGREKLLELLQRSKIWFATFSMKNNYMLDAISVQAVHKIFCLFIFIEDFLLVETFDGQLCYSGRTKSFPIILWERKINKSAQTKIFAFWMKISHISALSFSYISQAPIHKSIAIRLNLKLIGWKDISLIWESNAYLKSMN